MILICWQRNPVCMPRSPHTPMSSFLSSLLSALPLPLPSSQPIPVPTTTPLSPSLPPCCSCHSLAEKSGRKQFLSCLDVNNGSHLDSCECEGQCPPNQCGLRHCATSQLGAGGASPTGRGHRRRLRGGHKRPRSPSHSPHKPTRQRITTSPLTLVRRVLDDEKVQVINSSISDEQHEVHSPVHFEEKYPDDPSTEHVVLETPPNSPPIMAPSTLHPPTRPILRTRSSPQPNLDRAVRYSDLQEDEAATRQIKRMLAIPSIPTDTQHTPPTHSKRKRRASRSLSNALSSAVIDSVVAPSPRPLQRRKAHHHILIRSRRRSAWSPVRPCQPRQPTAVDRHLLSHPPPIPSRLHRRRQCREGRRLR